MNARLAGLALVVLASPAAAQQPAANDVKSALQRNWNDVSGWVAKAAELVPADQYTFKPAATVRSFGQLVAHFADGMNYYCGRASGRQVEWTTPVENAATDKATVTGKLRAAIDACGTQYAGTGRVSELLDNIAHTNLHYGNVITYLRLMNLVPPSS